MTFPNTTTPSLAMALMQLQSGMASLKTGAASTFMTLQANSVNTIWVFQFLDQCIGYIKYLDSYSGVTGLNAYATAQIPGYAGTLTTDIAAVRSSLVACVNWVITNFPKDSTNTYILGETLNADGTRTSRSFTTSNTVGLQNLLQAVIATIS